MSDFWSRRRAAVTAEAEAEAQVAEAERAGDQLAAQEARTDEEILTELNLKAPEEMQPGDDFSPFMQVAVPERLRRRALRVLWRSNPVLANVDNLVDYGEDFTDAATVIADLQTTYQVGKGMLAHVEKLAAEAAQPDAAAEDTEHAEELAAADDDVIEVAPVDAPAEDPTEHALIPDTPEEPPAPRRRMRFDFA